MRRKCSRNNFLQIILALTIMLPLYHCNEPPDQPVKAECEEGYIPCIDDSTICCPDIVSHMFEWEVFEFGDFAYGTNTWNDITIDNDENIWVAGKVHTDSTDYELGIYTGNEWELRDVQARFRDYFVSPELLRVDVINDSSIWLKASLPIFGDGVDWVTIDFREEGLSGFSLTHSPNYLKSPSSILFTGSDGTLLWYEDGEFNLLDFSIGWHLSALSVSNDSYYATGWRDTGENAGKSALITSPDGYNWYTHKSSNTFYPGENSNDPGLMSSCIAFQDTCFYSTPYGIRKYVQSTGYDRLWVDQWEAKIHDLTIIKMSGNSQNDLVMWSGNRNIVHFDGYEWNRYELEIVDPNFSCNDILLHGDRFIVVGISGSHKAVVAIGRR